MLRAMIVDDEAPARMELRCLLQESGRVGTIVDASSAREAVECLMDARVDVIFLDISMPRTSGLQLAEALGKLNHPPKIVFVTAHNEYALEAFDVDAVDYLVKPVESLRLERALDKVRRIEPPKHTEFIPPAATVDIPESDDRLLVEKAGHKLMLPAKKIRFIEAKDDYSCIYTSNDRFLSTASLAELEQRLNQSGFFRVHRGYIVNLRFVHGLEVVANGVMQLQVVGIPNRKISVSRRRVVLLKKALGLC